jgi:hypothetical protein
MSVRATLGRCDGTRCYAASGALAQRASQLTLTAASPVPFYSSCTPAARRLALAAGTGKKQRVSQGRPAGRFCPHSS